MEQHDLIETIQTKRTTVSVFPGLFSCSFKKSSYLVILLDKRYGGELEYDEVAYWRDLMEEKAVTGLPWLLLLI